MITIKKPEEIKILREGGRILAEALALVERAVAPGIPISDLDDMAREYMISKGGSPAFLGYGARSGTPGFPSTLCISINDEIVHGIGNRSTLLRKGDIVGLDIGVRYPADTGLFTDMATTVGVSSISPEDQRLITITRQSLDEATACVRPGVGLSEISKTIQRICEDAGYSVIRDLTGHGVGYEVHEDPPIYCYWDKRMQDVVLKEGMVICIEPMVAMGSWRVRVDDDQWTIRTADGSRAAHVEDTIVVTATGHEILTRP